MPSCDVSARRSPVDSEVSGRRLAGSNDRGVHGVPAGLGVEAIEARLLRDHCRLNCRIPNNAGNADKRTRR
jgi:hypothetical protein